MLCRLHKGDLSNPQEFGRDQTTDNEKTIECPASAAKRRQQIAAGVSPQKSHPKDAKPRSGDSKSNYP
jgi:hypothetical protein